MILWNNSSLYTVTPLCAMAFVLFSITSNSVVAWRLTPKNTFLKREDQN